MDKCRHLGHETLDGQAVEHFYVVTNAPLGDHRISELWISAGSGHIVRRFEIYRGEEFRWNYDYDPRKIDSMFLDGLGHPRAIKDADNP